MDSVGIHSFGFWVAMGVCARGLRQTKTYIGRDHQDECSEKFNSRPNMSIGTFSEIAPFGSRLRKSQINGNYYGKIVKFKATFSKLPASELVLRKSHIAAKYAHLDFF